MHARYYSHDLGRFLSVDQHLGVVGLSQTWNRYAYARNSPITWLDPDGGLEILACDAEGEYRYTIDFDTKKERFRRAANAARGAVLKALRASKWISWAIKAGKYVDKAYRGEPVTVYPDESGIAEVSGFVDGSRFEIRIMKEFHRYLAKRTFYGPRAEEALARSVETVIDAMVEEGKLTPKQAAKLRKLYDVHELFKKARSQATSNLRDLFTYRQKEEKRGREAETAWDQRASFF